MRSYKVLKKDMDRRIGVLIAVACCEVALRIVYRAAPASFDPLLFNLGARLAEMLVILVFSLPVCGVRAQSLKNEIVIGIGVSVLFGSAVVALDLASKLISGSGLLNLIIRRQQVSSPLLFFLTGCVVAPFVEELFFRGLFYSWLRERLPALACIVFSSIAFAGLHGFFSPVQLTGGLVFACLFEWRRNIWAPYIVHAAANFGILIFPWIYPL